MRHSSPSYYGHPAWALPHVLAQRALTLHMKHGRYLKTAPLSIARVCVYVYMYT